MMFHNGHAAGRYLRSIAIAQGDLRGAAAFAAGQRWENRDDIGVSLRHVSKSAVSAIGVSSGLAETPVGRDFLATLRPLEIFSRLTRVAKRPLRTRILSWTSGTTAAVVAEGAAAPMSMGGFTSFVLLPQKIVGTTVATDDLLKMAEPETDQSIATELAAAVGLAADEALVDPGVTGSVLNTAPAVASTGSTVAAIDADLEATVDALLTAGSNLSAATWLLSPKTATHLSLMRSGGLPAYPGIGAQGGQLAGLPALTSGAINGYIALIDQSGVIVGEDQDVELDQSNS